MTPNARAIILMMGAMLAFTCVDAALKVATIHASTGQVLLVTSLGSLAIFFPMMLRSGEAVFSRQIRDRAVLIRSVGELLAWIGLTESLRVAGLGTVTAVMQAQPLAVVLGAALFLREAVGWRRWLAIGVGFLGVVIILGPGAGGFQTGLLWTIPAIIGLTMRDLASRVLPKGVSTSFAVSWAMVLIAAYSVFLLWREGGWQELPGVTWGWLGLLILLVSMGMALITAAMRLGEASVVAPLRYTRIVFGLGDEICKFISVVDGVIRCDESARDQVRYHLFVNVEIGIFFRIQEAEGDVAIAGDNLARIAVDELDLVADFSGFKSLVGARDFFFQHFECCQMIAALTTGQREPQGRVSATGTHFQHAAAWGGSA